MKKNKKLTSSNKAKTATTATKDPLRFVVLAWILSVMVFPAVSVLVPGYFGDNSSYFSQDFPDIWEKVFYGIGIVNAPILIVSLIVSLALLKESSVKSTLPRLLRQTLVVATVINICFAFLAILVL